MGTLTAGRLRDMFGNLHLHLLFKGCACNRMYNHRNPRVETTKEITNLRKRTRDGKTGVCSIGKKPKSYYVYLLLCSDGSYYTGYTSNVASRLKRHEKGCGARYTRMRKPKRIIHLEEFKTRHDAMRRERQIKALTHSQKEHLARKMRETRHS